MLFSQYADPYARIYIAPLWMYVALFRRYRALLADWQPRAAAQQICAQRTSHYYVYMSSFLNMLSSIEKIEGSFLNKEGSFQKIQGSFLNIEGSFLNMSGSFQKIQGSFLNKEGSFRRYRALSWIHRALFRRYRTLSWIRRAHLKRYRAIVAPPKDGEIALWSATNEQLSTF